MLSALTSLIVSVAHRRRKPIASSRSPSPHYCCARVATPSALCRCRGRTAPRRSLLRPSLRNPSLLCRESSPPPLLRVRRRGEPGDTGSSFRGTTRIELMKMEILKNSLSHTQSGPTKLWPGISNYILQISSSKDPESPSAFIYFLDSGGGSYPEVISHAQVKWFQEKSQAINPHARIPELIFWHIPSVTYKRVAPGPMSTIHSPCIGSINDEEVASQVAEWGMMDALLKRSSVKAVFVGHNHGLDWCCPYQKLWLCFARHSGYGGYGTWPRGARIIEMTEDPFSLDSWIRMEDGTNHSYVTLSS